MTMETPVAIEQPHRPSGASQITQQESPEPALFGSDPVPRWKRVFDVLAIVCAAPLWLSGMICITAWIKLVSPGPTFFRQERVGLHGRRFMMLKFRSMKVRADTDPHENHFDDLVQRNLPMTKLDAAGDGRMILGGRIFRATGLDELPQLLNVLRGEMSLVGPRPCTPRELSRYQPAQLERFNACPGLTGFWQVNGKNKTTFREMIELDIIYAKNASLRLDLAIVLKTLPALLAQVCESRKMREVEGVRAPQSENSNAPANPQPCSPA